MPLETYQEVRPLAPAIRQVTEDKKMPPWFADPRYGRFSNDPSLTPTPNRDFFCVGRCASARRQSRAMLLRRFTGHKVGTSKNQM